MLLLFENHFKLNGSEYDDKGQISVTELINGKTVADVCISMFGNPIIEYYTKNFILDDSIAVASGQFFRNLPKKLLL